MPLDLGQERLLGRVTIVRHGGLGPLNGCIPTNISSLLR